MAQGGGTFFSGLKNEQAPSASSPRGTEPDPHPRQLYNPFVATVDYS